MTRKCLFTNLKHGRDNCFFLIDEFSECTHDNRCLHSRAANNGLVQQHKRGAVHQFLRHRENTARAAGQVLRGSVRETAERERERETSVSNECRIFFKVTYSVRRRSSIVLSTFSFTTSKSSVVRHRSLIANVNISLTERSLK
jgi:hypothetical protein